MATATAVKRRNSQGVRWQHRAIPSGADRTPLNACLALSGPCEEELWGKALAWHGMRVEHLGAESSIGRRVFDAPADRRVTLFLADMRRLAEERIDLEAFACAISRRVPATELMLTVSARIEVSESERAFVRRLGALDLVPMIAPEAAGSRGQIAQAIAQAKHDPGAVDLRDVLAYVPRPDAPAGLTILGNHGATPAAVAAWMRGPAGVTRRNRVCAERIHADCFTGREAVDCLAGHYGFDRRQAVEVGQFLLEHGVFHHVARERPFHDDAFLYRFPLATPAIEAIDLQQMIERMWSGSGGLRIAERGLLGRTYPACFVSSEAVDWMVAEYGLSREEAADVGQRLVDLGIVHNVVDGRGFTDGYAFFRFRRHEMA